MCKFRRVERRAKDRGCLMDLRIEHPSLVEDDILRAGDRRRKDILVRLAQVHRQRDDSAVARRSRDLDLDYWWQTMAPVAQR